jgi:hypothetical protein
LPAFDWRIPVDDRKLKVWALVAEIVSALAVVVSLIFLAYQVREGANETALNTEAVQSTALLQFFEQHSELAFLTVLNAELRDVATKAKGGLENLTDEESGVFISLAGQRIRSYYVGYQMMRGGLLPEDDWRTFQESLGRLLIRNPGYAEVWKTRREDYPEDFQRTVDDLLLRAKGENQ